ncbi:hypothetical protein LDL08_20640 [Nonomuraea glycinis]|uniref:Alkaline ceramidase n=1 Tax=Nonomuraea glycinis TaxID=2047744 RepID=A0A918ABX6_9ACTN|nr:hypothetical protein [Nonomuraea glycinis]MCA2178599.1 hypothetical protein [Nonomuraea glycinis]GGP13885.1 hypothetical protein GCM10012278_67450 [Nonomuraea glycinis]
MRVGHGTVMLPVPAGTPMGGYLDRPGPSTGVLDPLEVTAITWYDGRRRFALAVADVICVNEDLAARARAAVPEAGELWLAATHTHAGPETGCVPGGAPTPQPWRDLIAEATRAAVLRAVATERPASGQVRQGELREVGGDRSRPSGTPVVPLDVLVVRDPAGRTSGVLVVLPVHPTVLPAAGRLISADLVGAVRAALRARLGPGVWVVVATGAAGDISTRHTRRGTDRAELDRLGAVVAERCLELLNPTDPSPEPDGVTTRPDHSLESPGRTDQGREPEGVSWAGRRVRLGRVDGNGDPAALVAALRAAHAEALASGDPVAVRMARSRLDGARVLTGSAPARPTLDAAVGAARLGGVALAALPGEPFLGVRDLIRASRPEPVLVLGYVNGYPGYLPTADAYARAEYEVLAAQAAPGSAERLARTAADLLHELDERRGR